MIVYTGGHSLYEGGTIFGQMGAYFQSRSATLSKVFGKGLNILCLQNGHFHVWKGVLPEIRHKKRNI